MAALSARSCRLHPDRARGGYDVRLRCHANANGSPTEACSWVRDSNKTAPSSESSGAGQFGNPAGPPGALATASPSYVHCEIIWGSGRAIGALIPTVRSSATGMPTATNRAPLRRGAMMMTGVLPVKCRRLCRGRCDMPVSSKSKIPADRLNHRVTAGSRWFSVTCWLVDFVDSF